MIFLVADFFGEAFFAFATLFVAATAVFMGDVVPFFEARGAFLAIVLTAFFAGTAAAFAAFLDVAFFAPTTGVSPATGDALLITRNALRFFALAIQPGARPNPLQVLPLFGSAYFAVGATFFAAAFFGADFDFFEAALPVID